MDFSKIKNKKLQGLVAMSKSVASLPENEAEKLINRLARVPESRVEEVIAVFEKEDEMLEEAKKQQEAWLEEQRTLLESYIAQLKQLEREFSTNVREVYEKKSQEEDGKVMEEVIGQLTKI